VDPLMQRYAAVPPFALLEMPEQDFRRCEKVRRRGPSIKTRLARLVTFGGAVALTVYAAREMVAVVSIDGSMTYLQALMLVLFTITFGWIALSASAAVAGALFGGVRLRARKDASIEARTVLVMPVYNEDPARCFASLQAMALALLDRGSADTFEIFVLSDTTNPDVWIKETAALQMLRDSLGDGMRVWYRRRTENVNRKAGNLQDFVTRWGGRYDFMIVLDADSILSADTLLTMVREMSADTNLGLLQTVPRLVGGDTLLARLQQFAGTVYGPIVARGIAAWQGDDGNYWGHNAILRTRAFAAAAGLPHLAGRKPFGGLILSHDFVEAALLRRAGWSVRMLPTLGGSWEESPPTLLDVAARDRRWAQGNMQHLAVVGAKGLAWPNRVHMWIGVMSYLASPLWLALILVGLAVTAQVASVQFDYFGDELTLFPRWPRFDTERMVELFVFSMGVLLLPKIMGFLRALVNREMLKTVGIVRLVLGVPFETLMSALYAPISMLMQSRQVWEILRGRDSGWSVQSRKRTALPWGLLWRRHWLHSLAGIGISAGLAYVSPHLLAWMAPTLIGMALALPLSAASASVLLARLAQVFGLLTIPEEVAPPRVMLRRDEFEANLVREIEAVTIERLLTDDGARQRHFANVLPRPQAARGQPDLALLSARAKVTDARSVGEALAWLSPAERIAVLGEHELFAKLVELGRAAEQPRPQAPVLRTA
jgi:membrane glycosyltransferase